MKEEKDGVIVGLDVFMFKGSLFMFTPYAVFGNAHALR